MSRQPTTRTCFTLKASQVSALKRLHQQTGIAAAEAVRRALDSYLPGRVAGYVPGPLCPGPDADEAGPVAASEAD